MIPFKNHNPGLSFIEVMVALMIVSLVIIASFKTQGSLLRTTAMTVSKIKAVAALKDYFLDAEREAFLEKEGTQEKELEFPAMKLSYQATRAKDASVFKNIPDIMIEKVTATWSAEQYTQTLVRFTHKAVQKAAENSKPAAVQAPARTPHAQGANR
jgi:hypothetical protein